MEARRNIFHYMVKLTSPVLAACYYRSSSATKLYHLPNLPEDVVIQQRAKVAQSYLFIGRSTIDSGHLTALFYPMSFGRKTFYFWMQYVFYPGFTFEQDDYMIEHVPFLVELYLRTFAETNIWPGMYAYPRCSYKPGYLYMPFLFLLYDETHLFLSPSGFFEYLTELDNGKKKTRDDRQFIALRNKLDREFGVFMNM